MKEPELLITFLRKTKYIRADVTSFYEDGSTRYWESWMEHRDTPIFPMDIYNRTCSDMCEVANIAQRVRGRARYHNQIVVCPRCGHARVSEWGNIRQYHSDPRAIYELDSFDWPITFSICSGENKQSCRVYGDIPIKDQVRAALTMSEDSSYDPAVSHTQVAYRLGVCSYRVKVWLKSIESQFCDGLCRASVIVDHLFSTVWSPPCYVGEAASPALVGPLKGLPDPSKISPSDFPLPDDSGVYFLFDEQEVVYVGQSKSANARLREHRRSGKKFDSVAFLPVNSDYRLEVEHYYINRMQPALNKIGTW